MAKEKTKVTTFNSMREYRVLVPAASAEVIKGEAKRRKVSEQDLLSTVLVLGAQALVQPVPDAVGLAA